MTQNTISRPTSPHLQIYKWQTTMLLSILHRATGVGLAGGTILLVAWLCSAAYSPESFAILHNFFTGFIGKFLLFGWSLAFYFHLCNGIRFLFLDAGKGFDIKIAEKVGLAVAIASVVLTLATWIIIFASKGA